MPLDPTTAFGVACNIFQCVDFVSILLNNAKQIYESSSGMHLEHEDLEKTAKDLRDISEKIKQSEIPNTAERTDICEAAEACNLIASKLVEALRRLQPKKKQDIFKSLKSAFDSAWKKSQIDSIKARLDDRRRIMSVNLLQDIHKQLRSMKDEMLALRLSFAHMEASRATDVTDWLQSDLFKINISDKRIPPSIIDDDGCPRREIICVLSTEELASKVKHYLAHAADNSEKCRTMIIKYQKERKLLSSLAFATMMDRYNTILNTHENTFEWIFEKSHHFPEEDPRSRVMFTKWLLQGDGVYWISGKPGSGKSTLMKYISQHSKSKRHLQNWAGTRRLVIGGFYFWIGGSTLEKTQIGLMRQLLLEIIKHCPDLMTEIIPTRLSNEQAGYDWTLPELMNAFKAVSTLSKFSKEEICFCFFIDGLDEHHGNNFDLIKAIKDMSRVPHIKFCVSSRPWNIFEDAFGQDEQKKFYMQDLTQEDIATCTKDYLKEISQSCFDESSQELAEKLVTEVIARAQGVFLWVFLVMNSLKEGFVNADSLELLYDRLLEMPTDLEGFFERMIFSVDRVYRKMMYATFQVMLAASRPLPLLMFPFLDREIAIRAINRDLRSEYNTTTNLMASIKNPWTLARRQLNGRYKGLLEMRSHRCSPSVVFFHRTVQDYLETQDMQDKFAPQLGQAFSATHTGCNALLALALTWPKHWCNNGLATFQCLASEAYREGDPVSPLIINQLREALVIPDVISASAFENLRLGIMFDPKYRFSIL